MSDLEFAIQYIKEHDDGEVCMIDLFDELDELLKNERNVLSRFERNNIIVEAAKVAAPDLVIVD